MPTGRLMKNTHRQFAYSTSSPPASTPTAAPAPAIAAHTPSAWLRSAPSKVVVMIASAAGDSSAAPTPWPARAATRTVPVWARSEAGRCGAPAWTGGMLPTGRAEWSLIGSSLLLLMRADRVALVLGLVLPWL